MIKINKAFKIIFIAVISLGMLTLSGCEKKESKNAQVSEVLSKMKETVKLSSEKEESLKNIEVARRYGINPNDVEEGFVYHSEDEKQPDRIVLVKAKNKTVLEHIERALAAEVISMKDTWQDEKEQSKKVSGHVLKTRDVYVLLVVSDKSKEAEKIFDEMV